MIKGKVPKIQLVPLQNDYLSIRNQGREILGWNASRLSPRPFFFPLVGPSGESVTRIGHPAAANHGHHRSFWLGHNQVAGVNFWEEKNSPGNHPQIRQDNWLHYQDGDEEAGFACQLGWYDSQQARLLNQQLIVVIKPLPQGELWLEVVISFSPVPKELLLGKTNFGFMGLRVAKSISSIFGGGILRSANGDETEKNIFAKAAKWMDYSGPVAGNRFEGVTWFDHPSNPRHPAHWHVRDDGWMSPAFCLENEFLLKQSDPLALWYGLHIHDGGLSKDVADGRFKEYSLCKKPILQKGASPWPYQITRA